MILAIDFRITYNNDRTLRMFTREFWQDMAIARPDHHFIFITHEKILQQQPVKNIQEQALLKTRVAWIDTMRLKKKLVEWKADKLITVQETGFVISNRLLPAGKNISAPADKQVLFTGSTMPETVTGQPRAVTEIQPALADAITSLTWAETESIKTQYTGGRSFFLFTGNISEQHQLLELLKAFSLFKKWQQSNMQLVIAGSATSWTAVLEEKLLSYKYRQDVVLLKNIPGEAIAKLAAASYTMLYPVKDTAFPFALLWAAQSNKAIIATGNPVNRQTTDAASWIEPGNTAEDFARAMILLYKDESQQQLLVQRAREQAGRYNRRQMLAAAWQCIE